MVYKSSSSGTRLINSVTGGGRSVLLRTQRDRNMPKASIIASTAWIDAENLSLKVVIWVWSMCNAWDANFSPWVARAVELTNNLNHPDHILDTKRRMRTDDDGTSFESSKRLDSLHSKALQRESSYDERSLLLGLPGNPTR